MKVEWNGNQNIMVMHMLNGDRLEWPGSTWSRAGKHLTDDMFNAMNDWWASRRSNVLEVFDEQYRKIHLLLSEPVDPNTITLELRDLVAPILKTFDWGVLKLWCLDRNGGAIHYANGIKDSYEEKDRPGITFFTDEYIDLMVFSVMLKSVMPVWGYYHNVMDKVIGKDYLHMKAIEIITIPEMMNLPAWDKLTDYVHQFADLRITKDGFSLTKGIGRNEIPDYLFSLAIIKKIVIYNVRSVDRSIVTEVYHTLNERCGDVNKPGVTQKLWTDEKESEISIVDQYKIINRIPPGVSVVAEIALEEIDSLCADLSETLDPERARFWLSKINRSVDVMDYHLTLTGLVLNDVLGARNLQLVGYGHFINGMAVAAAYLEHIGFAELSWLLVSEPKKRDLYQISFAASAGRTYSHLTADTIDKLNSCYPYKSRDINPGLATIENIVKDVVRFDWDINHPKFSDIRESIANLLILTASKPFVNSKGEQK